jgi:hypothetical protein
MTAIRLRIELTGILLAAGLLDAAPPTVMETAVQVVSTAVKNVDAGHARVDITLKNVSQRTVTAWQWSVEGHYADGSTRSQSGALDDVSALIAPDPTSAFRPGTTRTFQASLLADINGQPPSSATTTLLMVAFDDQTALGDHVLIARLASGRRSMAAQLIDQLDEVQKLLQAPSPKAAAKARIAEQQAKHAGLGILQIYSLIANDAPASSVDSAVAIFRNFQSILAKHSVLKELP